MIFPATNLRLVRGFPVAIISLSSLTFPCLSLLKPRTAPPDDLKTLQPKEAKRTEVEVILGAAFLRLTANPFKTL